MVPIDLSDLSGSIEAKNIAGYHRNSSGMVDYIILNDVTGNAYEYGMMVGKDISTDPVYDENGELISEGSTRTSGRWSAVWAAPSNSAPWQATTAAAATLWA